MAAAGVGGPKTGVVGPTVVEELGGAVAAALTNTGAATVVRDKHRPERRPAVATASQLGADHVAPPPSLPLPSVVVMNARGSSLPQVRKGGLRTKAKAAKATAEAAAAAAAAVAAAAATEVTPVVSRSKDVTPSKVNGGGGPRWGQLVETAGQWEVTKAAPVAAAWGQPPPSSKGQRVQQHGQQPHHAARSYDDTREASPAAATAAVANVVARGSHAGCGRWQKGQK